MITIKMSPSGSQREIIESLDQYRTIVVNGGRRYGKTLLSQMALLKFAFAKPRSRVLFASHAHSHNRDVFSGMIASPGMDELVAHAAVHPVPLMTLVNGSIIKFASMEKPNKARGGGYNLIVVDEAREVREEAWKRVLSPMASADRAPILMLSTPKGADHWWYQLFLRGMEPNGDKIKSFLRPSTMSTCYGDGWVASQEGQEELDREKRIVGEDAFLVEYMCQPISTGDHAFKSRHLDDCLGGECSNGSGEPCYMGLDLGKQRDPAAVVVMTRTGQVLHTKVFDLRTDWVDVAKDAGAIASKYRAICLVDTHGTTRDSIIDFFRPYLPGIRKTPFTDRNKEDMVGGAQLALERKLVRIPTACTELLSQLRSYEATSKGNWVVYSCPNGHDDLVAAFLLAVRGCNDGNWGSPIVSSWSDEGRPMRVL